MLRTALAAAALATAAVAQEDLGTVIGIDLGTTYSCVGVFQNGRVEIIANDQGNRVTPSYVAFTESERLVGDAAKIQASLNPENTVYDSKRLIGRRFRDEHVQADMQLWPFTVVEIDGGKPAVQVTVGGERKGYVEGRRRRRVRTGGDGRREASRASSALFLFP